MFSTWLRITLFGLTLAGLPTAAWAGATPTVNFTAIDSTAAEAGQETASFSVTRTMDGNFDAPLRVHLQLGGAADRGPDYTTTNLFGTGGDNYFLDIPASQTSQTVTITPVLDNLIEGPEDVTFMFLEAQTPGHDYIIGAPSSGSATITDDVAEVTLTEDDTMAAEAGQDTAAFTVMRNMQGNF
ncbi:MAG: hypothetical protein R3212_10590, partial [Xanthomonadales bacterium]|nr:hypothetical protein [Xanthomonadales bacterium]